ncbi:hypothetical protein, partial [Roseovarius sp. SYSU LYC5161]|uniref:hypothetical protein n=1 Tax=Roseovarius halophilus (ex Wu et al. 2025) TaxID=3376060 RepID=UPI003999E042
EPGPVGGPYAVGGVRIGSPICEDSWYEDVAKGFGGPGRRRGPALAGVRVTGRAGRWTLSDAICCAMWIT